MSDNSKDEQRGRMLFEAFSDQGFGKSLGKKYTAIINPDSFTRSYSIQYNSDKTNKKSPTLGSFQKANPEQYTFTLLFDGTGIVDSNRFQVDQEIKDFTDVLLTSTKNGYKPNYIAMQYCGMTFHCAVTSLKVNYTLFKRDGDPLRAKIDCSFSSVIQKEHEDKEKKKKITPPKQQECSCVCVCNNESPQAAVEQAENNNMCSMFSSSH